MTDHTPPEVPPFQPTQDAAGASEPPAYGAPYAAAPPTGLSITSFVLGLVSIFFGFVFFVPIAGLVLGILALKKEPTARGFAIAGIWINAVMLGLVVLGIIVIVILVAIFGAWSIPYMNQVGQIPGTPA
jgi:hypothetical protein